MAQDTARLFFALWPDAQVRAALAQYAAAWRWPARAAPMRAEKLHLTLHFLGDVERRRLPELARLRQPFAPFTLRLGRPELWQQGIAVVLPHALPTALAQLQAALGDSLRGIGLPVDAREFHPHVTLARRAGTVLPPPMPLDLAWRVEHFALVESTAQHGYTVLERYDSATSRFN